MRNSNMEKEQYCLVEFGVKLFMDSCLKIAGLLVLGAIFGQLEKVIIVLSVFCITRYFAGGVHCESHAGCFVSMAMICVGSVMFSRFSDYLPSWIVGVALIHVLTMVIMYAPRNSQINPIMDQAVIHRKRVGSIVCTTIMSVIIMCINELELKWMLTVPLFIEAVTISPIFYRRNRNEGKKHEAENGERNCLSGRKTGKKLCG